MYEYEKCFIPNISCRKYNSQPVIGDMGFEENENMDENEADNVEGADDSGADNQFNTYGSDVTDPEFQYENISPNSPYGRRPHFQPYTNIDASDNEFNYQNAEVNYNLPAESLRLVPPYGNMRSQYSSPADENRNFQYLRSQRNQVVLDRKPKSAYQSYYQGGYTMYENSRSAIQTIPTHCYQPLSIVKCSDTRVISNSWFYNFCADECMLYASDICDPNTNKFTSLEKCEQHCAEPMRRVPNFLKRKQLESPFCQRILRNNRYNGYVN